MPLCFVRAVLSQPCLSFAKNLVNNEYKETSLLKKRRISLEKNNEIK